MSLDPPYTGIHWRDYRIETPTFGLSPVEKPDMSPYLVHMTGQDAIEKILAGENSPTKLAEGAGFLMAVVPEYDGLPQLFSRPVVCFSESPLFALDFFRYRSFRRWREDQRFGIGFNKAKLVERGVRPVVYLDAEIRSSLRALQKLGEVTDWNVAQSSDTNDRLRHFVESLAPLVFPLLEDHEYQGFMWEREWRATSRDGLPFGHEDIEIICCPGDEEAGIRRSLGDHANHVQFVRTWLEYDDVTSFLRQREDLRRPYESVADRAAPLEDQIRLLEQQRVLHEVAIHSLESFVALSEQIASKADLAKRELDALREKKVHIDQDLAQARVAKETKDKEQGEAPAKRQQPRRSPGR